MRTESGNGYCTPDITVFMIQVQSIFCFSNGSEIGAGGEGQGPCIPGEEEEG